MEGRKGGGEKKARVNRKIGKKEGRGGGEREEECMQQSFSLFPDSRGYSYVCIFMFSKASEIEWFSIDKELSPSHLHRPNANWETVLI